MVPQAPPKRDPARSTAIPNFRAPAARWSKTRGAAPGTRGSAPPGEDSREALRKNRPRPQDVQLGLSVLSATIPARPDSNLLKQWRGPQDAMRACPLGAGRTGTVRARRTAADRAGGRRSAAGRDGPHVQAAAGSSGAGGASNKRGPSPAGFFAPGCQVDVSGAGALSLVTDVGPGTMTAIAGVAHTAAG